MSVTDEQEDGHTMRVCNVQVTSPRAAVLRRCVLIVWDEAMNARRDDVEAVDWLLQEEMGNAIPFNNDGNRVLPHR